LENNEYEKHSKYLKDIKKEINLKDKDLTKNQLQMLNSKLNRDIRIGMTVTNLKKEHEILTK